MVCSGRRRGPVRPALKPDVAELAARIQAATYERMVIVRELDERAGGSGGTRAGTRTPESMRMGCCWRTRQRDRVDRIGVVFAALAGM